VIVAQTEQNRRYPQVRRVTVVGAIVDLVLGVAKIIIGVVAHSQALIADGVHSLSDLGTDGLVLWAAKHGSVAADAEHPYGHARFETVATVALAIALIGVAIGIAFDAIRTLFHPEQMMAPGIAALVVASISALSKEAIYHYTIRAARRLGSDLLRANAWHSRSDALSSVVVVVGISGTMAGLLYLDAVAAVIVAAMIAHIGWKLIMSSVQELVDTGVEQIRLKTIKDTILSVEGVKDVHQLRTRHMGSQVLADAHVLVDPRISVSEGHRIGDAVEQNLSQHISEIADFTVHIDPEDDTAAAPSSHLPLRDSLLRRVRQQWPDNSPKAERMTLHYLNGKVHLEVWLPLGAFQTVSDAQALTRAVTEAFKNDSEVAHIEVLFH